MASLGRGHIGVKKIVALSRQVAVQAQGWMVSRFLGVVAAETSTLRIPLITRILPKPPAQQLTFATNLLLTTLAVSAAVAPFTPANATQLDPVRPRAVYQQVQQGPNLLLSTLSVPIGTNSNEPVPRLRTVQQPDGPLNLLTTTLFVPPVVPDPFHQTEWPNPAKPAPMREYGFTQAQVFNTADPIIQSPFTQAEWANPVRAVASREYGFVQSQIFNTADVVVQTPFHQDDWQNPLRVIPRAQVPLHRYAGEPVLPVGIPFYQTEWPNPVLTIPPTDGFAAHRDLDALAVVPPPAEFPTARQLDWPNPVRAVPSREYGSVQPQIFNTADVVNTKPFLQTNWPNPIRSIFPRQPIGVRELETLWLPFNQYDWPNPILKPRPGQGLVVSQIFNTADVPKPFVQTEWPNPVRRVPLREHGFTQPQLFNTPDPVVQSPFHQDNWPNPVLAIKTREFGSVQAQIFNTEDLPNPFVQT